MSLNRPAAGFTIVELMIAAFVFSLVMLAALTGFMLVGRIFYQGVSMTQTQNTAQKIVDDISGNISTATAVSGPTTTSDGYGFYCVGNARYTYLTNSQGKLLSNHLDLSDQRNYAGGTQGGNFGLLRDVLPGDAPCASPDNTAFKNPVEMLSNDMRLSDFSIAPSSVGSGGLYNIAVTIAYGNDNVLDLSQPTAPSCLGGSSHTQFCAVVGLNTSVYQGLHS